MSKGVSIVLENDEAIVIFEWLSKIVESDQDLPSIGNAERIAFESLLNDLEKVLPEPFDPNYREILKRAQLSILNKHRLD